MRAGIEVERLFRPHIQNVLGGGRHHHGGHHVILGPVVLVARGVREQHTEGDLIGAGQLRQVLRDRIVESELALLRQQQDSGRGELLADRPDGVLHLRGGLHRR